MAGIPKEVQKRVFDPFFTTKPAGKGTGLGMSISHQIVTEKHGGSLSCISSPGKGAEFIIEIPIQLIKLSNTNWWQSQDVPTNSMQNQSFPHYRQDIAILNEL